MTRSRAAAIVSLIAILLLAGCSSPLGPRQIPDDRLNGSASYAWNGSANATYELEGTAYRATVDVNGSRFVAYKRTGLGNRRPIRMRAVAYRAPNGSTINGSALSNWISVKRTETVVRLPASGGQFGYSASATPKRFATPVLVQGRHTVILPPNRSVSHPIAAHVRPSPDERNRTNDQVHLRWQRPGKPISVQYYLPRDLTLLGGLILLAGVIGGAAAVRVWLQIRALRQEREAEGLDVDVDDPRDRPPPGMR